MSVSVKAGGVSAEVANPDLGAMISGGEAFVARMKEIKAERELAEASFAKLKIGKDAAAAYADAQQNQQVAKQAILDAQAEATRIINEAKAKAEIIVTEGAREVEKLQNAKRAEFSQLDKDLKAAKDVLAAWSDETTKRAEALLAEAQAQSKAADAKMVSNKRREDELIASQKELAAKLHAAEEAEDSFNAKLAAIKAAAS